MRTIRPLLAALLLALGASAATAQTTRTPLSQGAWAEICAAPCSVSVLSGIAGLAGIVPSYGPTGLRSGVKVWVGSVTAANGLWTANISSAGCTAAPYNVQAQAQGVDTTAAGVRMANVSGVSATSLSGNVSQPATVSLLGVLSLTLATTGTPTIFVEAWCN